MIGKLRKKDKPPAEAPKPAADPGSAGTIRLFRMPSGTTAIRAGAIPAQTFEVPPDYRKVTPR